MSDNDKALALKFGFVDFNPVANSNTECTKPGDIVAMLAPRRITCHNVRVLLIHRMWPDGGERGRSMCLVGCRHDPTGGVPSWGRQEALYLGGNGRTRAEVRTVRMKHAGDHRRTLFPTQEAPAYGVNEAGETYVTCRFLLYSDGFARDHTSSASVQGVYLQWLNFPENLRNSADTTRVLTLAPPGVRVSSIYRLLAADIRQGRSEGFLSRNPNGQEVRIYLDLIGVVGDTPA